VVAAYEEMQAVFRDERQAQLRTALGGERLAQGVVVVEKILPDRLALKERVKIDLLLRFRRGRRCGFRLRLRFGRGLRRGRSGGAFLTSSPIKLG